MLCRAAVSAVALALACSTAVHGATVSNPAGAKSVSNYIQAGSDKYSKGDLDGAISEYNQAIKLNPRVAEAYYDRGVAHNDQGSVEDALAD